MERMGTVTILFTDVVDSTRHLQRLGDRRWERVRRAHFTALRSALATHSGTEVKNTGDGLMAAFHSAVDAAEGALAMLRAARGEVDGDEVVRIRVGIATGEATSEQGDYFGTPVVEAARLCGLAAPGEILATTFVRLLAEPHEVATFDGLGTRDLKGFAAPIEVWRVGERPLAHVSAFGAVDRTPGGGERLVTELDYWDDLPTIQAMRADALARLQPLPGDTVCDLGCGSGSELLRLARIVGPEGRAIGIEVSAAMLAESQRRADAAGLSVELLEADGRATGLPDDSVDCLRIERVIQHVGDVDGFLAEAKRITRPGGQIVIADTDWGSLVSHPGDRAVLLRLKGSLEHGVLAEPWSGRMLHGAMLRAGLEDVTSQVHPITAGHRADSGLKRMLVRAVDAGVVSDEEYKAHREASLAALADGSFVYAFLMFVAAGRVPEPG